MQLPDSIDTSAPTVKQLPGPIDIDGYSHAVAATDELLTAHCELTVNVPSGQQSQFNSNTDTHMLTSFSSNKRSSPQDTVLTFRAAYGIAQPADALGLTDELTLPELLLDGLIL